MSDDSMAYAAESGGRKAWRTIKRLIRVTFIGALIVLGLVKPDLLEPLNRGWAKLGLLLHKITNPIVLGVMYGGAIVPTGLLMRLFGADPMGMKRQPNGTYWNKREKVTSTAQSIEKPF